MTGYSFQEKVPSGLSFDFDSGIFHNPLHLQLQSTSGWHSYVMIDDTSNTIVGLLHVHVENGIAVSPLRSPYGSILFSRKLTPDLITQFVLFVENNLNGLAKKIQLKHAPEIYSSDESELLRNALKSLGYESTSETSAVIPVTASNFESIVQHSAKKRLRKCKDAGFQFNQQPLSNLESVYQFLKGWREQKGYTLSMSLDELKKVINIFSDVFFLTVVTDKNLVVAANLSIQVNARVLYNFYHDHDADYDVFSPVVMLNEGLYVLCQQRKLELLDLGTSQTDGNLNESLFNFKLKLGAQPSNKYTFVKNLS